MMILSYPIREEMEIFWRAASGEQQTNFIHQLMEWNYFCLKTVVYTHSFLPLSRWDGLKKAKTKQPVESNWKRVVWSANSTSSISNLNWVIAGSNVPYSYKSSEFSQS